jgi:hypothetical protein
LARRSKAAAGLPITAAVSWQRGTGIAVAVSLYALWGVWVGLYVFRPSDPTEDMSAYDSVFKTVVMLVYLCGGFLLVRSIRRRQVIRTVAVSVLVVPPIAAALILTVVVMGGSFW